MPFVEIFSSRPSNVARQEIGDAVHEALVEALQIPLDDRVQFLRAISDGDYVAHPHYLGIARSPGGVVIRITLRRGRSPEMKQALSRCIADNIVCSSGIRPEDLLLILAENETVDWSFGNGIAQYANH